MSKVSEGFCPEEYGCLATQKELKIQKIENKKIEIDFEFWKEIAGKKYLKFILHSSLCIKIREMLWS